MLKRPELFSLGFHKTTLSLPEELSPLVKSENWTEVDKKFQELCSKDGSVFKFLNEFHDFTSIEFIISIRDATNEWEEDGIWHDDGSRVFAFSLSLSLEADSVKGGRLGIRRIGEERGFEIPTPSYGGIILFLTGLYGYEHRIHQVTAGKRVIIAGWCS